jgi:multidrug efflux pump subunit AcrA (membrane-fusion protein)
VTTGQRSGGYVEIFSGLEAGEAIVSHGVHRVRDGAPVRVQRRDGAENNGERIAGSDRTSTI